MLSKMEGGGKLGRAAMASFLGALSTTVEFEATRLEVPCVLTPASTAFPLPFCFFPLHRCWSSGTWTRVVLLQPKESGDKMSQLERATSCPAKISCAFLVELGPFPSGAGWLLYQEAILAMPLPPLMTAFFWRQVH